MYYCFRIKEDMLLPDKSSLIQFIRLPERDKVVDKLVLIFDATHKLFLYNSILI